MRKALLLLLAVLVTTTTALAGDPPARVARLSYLSGEVSIQPGGVNDWVQANINRPLTSSDRLWADNNSRAELQMGGGSLRVDNNTSMTLVNVSDNNVQVRVDQGTASLHVGELFDGDIYEIDTPNVAFIVRKKGDYRFDVDNAGDTTSVTVFRGEGDATGEGPMIRIKKEQRYTFTLGRSLQYSINNNPGLDGFDQWAMTRSKLEDESASARYVSPYAVGAADLDQYGAWVTVAPYGPVWYPRVVAGWAPYRYGHWVWVSPWGWTWVDDAPWGFAPFHYGRWVYYGSRWGWCPGPYRGRPVYAPALVGWFGGGGWGVSVSFGIGGGVGWFPLGWGEPYIPYYGHSRGYFQHVNVTNTRITNITYVTKNYYGDHHRNWDYRYGHDVHAVTAVSNDTFRTSRPTRDGFMHLSDNDIKHAKFESSVPVRPTTDSVLGPNAGQHRAAPPSDWKRPSRPERTTVTTDASPGRPDVHRDPVGRDAANNGGDRRWENGQPNRGYARPGNPPTTAENERPRGMPNTSVNSPASDSASVMPSRVPRPPRGTDHPQRDDHAQNNVRQSRQDGVSAPESARVPAAEAPAARPDRTDREDRPQSYARPTRQDTVAAPEPGRVPAAESPAARVPRPTPGEVVRPDRHQDSVNRDQARPAPRTYENSRPEPQSQMRQARPEGVTRDMRPQTTPAQDRPARTEAPRPAEQPHAAPAPASKPTPERNNNPHVDHKVQNERNQSSVRYPRPYGTVQPASYNSFASSSSSYTRTTSDYTPQSYRNYSRPSYHSNMSTTPRASYSASSSYRSSYSQPRTYSQASSSAPRSYSSGGMSRSSSYSAPSRSASSRGSGSPSHSASHGSSSGSHGSSRSGRN